MVKDNEHRDDEVFELTTEMASKDGAKGNSALTNGNRDSGAPGRSPFTLLSEQPAVPEAFIAPESVDEEGKQEEHVKVAADAPNAVVTAPIHSVSVIPPANAAPVDRSKPSQPPVSKTASVEFSAESSDDDEGIMELGQNLVVSKPPAAATAGDEISGTNSAVAQNSSGEKTDDVSSDETLVTVTEEDDLDKQPTAPVDVAGFFDDSGDGETAVLETDDGSTPLDESEGEELEMELDGEEIDLDDAEELEMNERQNPVDVFRSSIPPNKGKRRRRSRIPTKEWWANIFDDDYLMMLPEATERDTRKDLDFIENTLSVPSGSLIMDLACGNGRHAIAMAKRNYRVVGVDLSLSMLAHAGEAAQEAGQKINFIHGDMRDLGFDKTFDGVYCVGTSFGYFDEETNIKVLEGVYRSLKPGAPFMFELINRDFIITRQPNLTWFSLEGLVCMEETDFNYINSRLYITRQTIYSGGERQEKYDMSVRLYSLHEIGHILHQVGFAVTKVSGHRATPGAFFGADSSKLIISAERRR